MTSTMHRDELTDDQDRVEEVTPGEAAPAVGRTVTTTASHVADARPVKRRATDATAGEILHSARLRVGVPIEELSAATRIRPGLIQAIEADEFERCGGDFYAKAHLRSLARELHLDPNLLLSAYRRQYPADSPSLRGSVAHKLGGQDEPAVYAARPRWAVIVAVGLVLLMAWGFFRLISNGTGSDTQALPTNSPSVSVSTEPETPVTQAPPPVATVTFAMTSSADQLMTIATQKGTVIFQGMVKAGETKQMTRPSMVRVWAQKPDALSLTVNSRKINVPGERFVIGQSGKVSATAAPQQKAAAPTAR